MTTVGIQKAKKGLGLVPFASGTDLAEHDAALLAANGRGDASVLWRHALYPGHVFLLDPSFLHGAREKGAAVWVFGNGQGTPRFSVKAADGAKHKGAVAVEVCQGVGQGVLPVAVSGVGGHPRGLVAYHHVLVLVENGNREGNGGQMGVGRFRFVLYGKGKEVARAQNSADGDSSAIQEDAVLFLFQRRQKTGGNA